MTKTIDAIDAQKELPDLLNYTKAGNDVIISEDNVPVARLTSVRAPSKPTKRIAGLHKGMIWTSDDFDEPLGDDFWLGER